MLTLTIDLKGTQPLLEHNSRLANPLDPITRRIKELAAKRNKTDQDYRVLLPLEAYGGTYETAEGLLALPTENVWKSIQEAANVYRLGKKVKSALLFEPNTMAPLLIEGETQNAHDFVYEETGNNLFIRTVVVKKNRVLKARPIIRHWACTHTFLLLDDVINPKELEPVLEHAGRLVGVGDWRPIYGKYTVTRVEVNEERKAA